MKAKGPLVTSFITGFDHKILGSYRWETKVKPTALSCTIQTFTSGCALQHGLFGITVPFGQEIILPCSHPHVSFTVQDHSLSSCTSVLTSRINHTYLFVRQTQCLLGQDPQMRLGKRSEGNLTTVATGPFFSLAGKTSDSRENSFLKDRSFHSSAHFSREFIFFPSLPFTSKKLLEKMSFCSKGGLRHCF